MLPGAHTLPQLGDELGVVLVQLVLLDIVAVLAVASTCKALDDACWDWLRAQKTLVCEAPALQHASQRLERLLHVGWADRADENMLNLPGGAG